MLTRVHHVGLVVRRLEDGLALWQDTLGLRVSKQATVVDQGVKAALLPIGRSEIELLEPINADGGVAKVLEKRGEGLHHVCFETPAVAAELDAARAQGFPLIDETPRAGLAGDICFLHPKGTHGVLVEFATPPPGEHHQAAASSALAGLALCDVAVRSRDAVRAADVFHAKLGLARADAAAVAPGIVAAAVSAGDVRLLFLSPDPQAATPEAAALRAEVEAQGEGIAGLVLEVANLATALDALAGLSPVRQGDLVRLAAERCRGVPLAFRRA
ncbi:MAG: methylmalonyl-CoA epimerase [Candidatus Binatia bacterium]